MSDNPRAEGGDVVVDSERMYDTREVSLSVSGAPTLYTAKGKRPIEPYHVRLTYDITRQIITSVTVLGRGEPNPRNYREHDGRVRRRVDPGDAPYWLALLIKEYTP
jgi:hypothetical protein